MSSTTTITATAASRKPKWHPAQPTPKILNLPRRIRHRKQPKKPTKKSPFPTSNSLQKYHPLLDMYQGYYYGNGNRKEKLERLFGEQREFSRSDCSVPIVLLNSSSSSSSSLPLSSARRRRKTLENDREEEGKEGEISNTGGERGVGGFVEEKWKFQAEMLRAECNFLRKERELALKKLEKNRVQMQRTLRSAVETLTSGRKKIFEGKNVSAVLEEEIEDLAEKLEELHRNSDNKFHEVRKCSNFDKQAYYLQRRLEKLGCLSDGKHINDSQEQTESSLIINMNHEVDKDKESCVSGPGNQMKSTDVELLRRTMEGLSKEIRIRLEEDFGPILSDTANSSVASSASTSKRIECPPESTLSSRIYQESMQQEDGKCTGRCKAVVRKIMEQVRVETEQWSQMQGMLGKVREEMEELQASRKFWEDEALSSESRIKILQSYVQEWKEKARKFEIKADELHEEISVLRGKLEKANCNQRSGEAQNTSTSLLPPSKRPGKENHTAFYDQPKESHQTDDKGVEKYVAVEVNRESTTPVAVGGHRRPVSLGEQLEKEKRLLPHHPKEKHQANDNGRKKSHAFNSNGPVTVNRSPFRDIRNSSHSHLMKQSCRTIFPLHN